MRRLRREWRNDAECKETDTGPYFTAAATDITEVRNTCGKCIVRYECLAHALDFPERYGFWGGMTEGERNDLRRRYKRVVDWHGVIESAYQSYGIQTIAETKHIVESMAARAVAMTERTPQNDDVSAP